MTSQSSWINQLVKIFNSTHILNSLLNALLEHTLKLRMLFHYKEVEYTRLEGTINTSSRLIKRKKKSHGRQTHQAEGSPTNAAT